MGSRQVAPARAAALAVLSDVRRRDGRARDVMRASAVAHSLDARDLALAERLVLGVTAAVGVLDAMLAAHLSKPRGLQPRVRDALRLSAFELAWLQTPSAVAASQGVELVRSVAPRAAGLANAVLRRVASEEAPRVREAMAAVASGEASRGEIALATGWPTWLAEEVVASVGTEAACRMAACALEPAPVWVSGNPALHDADACRVLLVGHGMSPKPDPVAGAWELSSARGLASSGLVESSDVVVSDLAARLVAAVASPAPGSRVLEVGQGRATKTLLLEGAAVSQGGPCDIVGVDSVPHKTRVATERLSRGWSDHVTCVTADARELAGDSAPEAARGEFDLVFVDAPCSGTGTMRRHPEIAWSLARDSVVAGGELPRLQLDILRAASSRVAPAGSLVFSTCSVLDSEDSRVVDEFLASPEGARFAIAPACDAPAVSADPTLRELVSGCSDARGMFRSHPREGSFDGHFCVRLERRD